MEIDINISAVFKNDSLASDASRIYMEVRDLVSGLDQEIKNDESTRDTCVQLYGPYSIEMAKRTREVLEKVSGENSKPNFDCSDDIFKHLGRGLSGVVLKENKLCITLLVIDFEKEIAKLLLQLMLDLKASSVEASGSFDEEPGVLYKIDVDSGDFVE
ncbi:MAG: hypothetical protein OER98_16635 [Gammaproteobacteria bacterium]|nr:hypothetical protein [Gammaproteobacteria bacterium]